MKVDLDNVVASVTEATDVERSWLTEYLSYKDRRYIPGARTYRERDISLFNSLTNEFPAGLLRLAYDEAKRQGKRVEVRDLREAPCQADPKADLEWLKTHPVAGAITHQIEAVQAALRWRRGIIWAPTASGKTDVAIGIVKALPCRWLFLTHRADLLAQTAERYRARTGDVAGVVGGGSNVVGNRFTVATFQAIWQSIERGDNTLIASAEGVIVDETHCAAAETFWNVLMRATKAYFRIGLSATPLARGDGRNLLVIGALGPVIYRVLPEHLVRLGLLAKPKIRMLAVSQKSDCPTWRGVYGEAVVRSKRRNAAVVAAARLAEKPCLVFVQEVKHGRALLKMLGEAGIAAEFVWGEKNLELRRAAVQRLVRTDIDVLVCNVIFQEGIDIPSLRSVVVASGGKSTIAALQRIGRGMRVDAASGKTEFEVWDIADRGCGCSRDDVDGCHFGCKVLERQTKLRMKAYTGEGFDVEVVPEGFGKSLL